MDASRSEISISIRSNAVENVFPCASVINDNVPPPPRLSCSKKFNAPIFGNSNLSTSPRQMPLKCCLTRSAVTSRTRIGYSSSLKAINPTFAVSPLSPERAWANFVSCNLIFKSATKSTRSTNLISNGPDILFLNLCFLCFLWLRFQHFNSGPDLLLRDQRRPVSNNLFHLWTATRKSRHRRWTSQNQRRNLFRESFDRITILSPHTNSQLHFRNVRTWSARQRAMRRIHSHKLRQHLLKL